MNVYSSDSGAAKCLHIFTPLPQVPLNKIVELRCAASLRNRTVVLDLSLDGLVSGNKRRVPFLSNLHDEESRTNFTGTMSHVPNKGHYISSVQRATKEPPGL
jgi:hypothetical protein